MHTMRVVMRGIDITMEENPTVAFLGIAVIAFLGFMLMNGRVFWLKEKVKAMPETKQYIVGFGICLVFLSMVVLLSVLWAAGSSAGYP